MIIDFHTHVFSPRIKKNRSKYIDEDPCFAILYSKKDTKLVTADEIIDRATYAEPGQPSKGIPHVIVNGVLAVEDGELTGKQSGKVIRRARKILGVLPELGRIPSHGVEVLR